MTDEETKIVPPPPKFPLRGMPFGRKELGRATKHAMDAAHREGKRIDWEEARARGFKYLLLMHFPWFKPRYKKVEPEAKAEPES